MRISDWSSDVCSSDFRRGHRGLPFQSRDDPGAGHLRGARHRLRPDRIVQEENIMKRGAIAILLGALALMSPAQAAQPWEQAIATAIGKPGAEMPGGVYRIGRSEEHTSELQSLMRISYAVFCLKKKTQNQAHYNRHI